MLPNVDDTDSKRFVVGKGLREWVLAEEQLYDLVRDPGEACNLAGARGSEAVRDDLRARLAAWMARTGDPLLKGPVPLPEGAWANNVDGESPLEGGRW